MTFIVKYLTLKNLFLKENNKLAEKLTTYLKELPKLPHELGLKTYEPSILDIETDWNKFVGEATVQVNLNISFLF